MSVEARIVVASNTFDTTIHGWDSLENWASVNREASGGNPVGWFKTSWTNLTNPLEPGDLWESDLFATQATNLFAGTWSTNMYFELDFWAETNAPAVVRLEWGSTNSRVWKNTIFDTDDGDSMGVTNWTTLASVNFTDSSVWNPFGDPNDFLNDLANIDWIGVRIYRPGTSGEVYGIDNFNLMVPEPAEVILLLVAGLSSWMSLRKKKRAISCSSAG